MCSVHLSTGGHIGERCINIYANLIYKNNISLYLHITLTTCLCIITWNNTLYTLFYIHYWIIVAYRCRLKTSVSSAVKMFNLFCLQRSISISVCFSFSWTVRLSFKVQPQSYTWLHSPSSCSECPWRSQEARDRLMPSRSPSCSGSKWSMTSSSSKHQPDQSTFTPSEKTALKKRWKQKVKIYI